MDKDEATLRQFFAAFSDETRLRLAAEIVSAPRSLSELAGCLNVKERELTRHLGMLEALGLLATDTSDGTARYQLNIDALRAMRKSVLARDDAPLPTSADDIAQSDLVILARFLDGDRLKEIPSDRGKRLIVLTWLANQFEHERRYSEREVNETIGRHHPDFAALRRYLIDHRLIQRENNVYWRIPE